MKKLAFVLAICLFNLLSENVKAQLIDIPMAQPDNRFTVSAKRYWNSVGDEQYLFFVQNNTDQEYKLVIRVTLDLACYGRQTFNLGYTGEVYLKPRGLFIPSKDDNTHNFLGGNAESRLSCRIKDGNSYTFLKSAMFQMTDIVNVSQEKTKEAKRLEEEGQANLKAEEERKRLADEKKRIDEADRAKKLDEQKKVEEEKAKLVSTNTKSASSSDDFWNSDNKSNSKSNSGSSSISSLPDFFKTTDGKYWKKTGDKLQQIGYDDYMALQLQRKKELDQSPAEKKLSPEEQKKLVDQIVADNNTAFNNYFKTFDDISRKFELDNQSMAAGRAVKETKRALDENSLLGNKYQSVDQLMNEFNQKMANVNRMTTELTTQRNNQLFSATDARFNKPGYEASIGAGIKLIGGIVNNAKAAKEKKEAQEQLQLQKQIALNKIAAEERKLLSDIRTDLFKRFTEAPYPTAASKIETPALYFFSYAYDPAQIGTKQAILYLSNVFVVNRYSDNTWPFKNSIVSELSKLTPYSEIMHGYYTSEAEAVSMRQGLNDIFIKTGGSITPFDYKGKKNAIATSATGPKDFWENGKKALLDSTQKKALADSTQKKAIKVKDSFWDN